MHSILKTNSNKIFLFLMLFFVISLILGNQTADKEKSVDEWQNLEVPAAEQTIDSDVPATEQSIPVSSDADVPVAEVPKEEDVPN